TSFAMAFDSGRGKVVLHGGLSFSELVDLEDPETWVDPIYWEDTWEWDGASWTQVETTGAPPRFEHAMAYDPMRGKVVLFGGATGDSSSLLSHLVNDTWEWDGVSWTQVATTGP